MEPPKEAQITDNLIGNLKLTKISVASSVFFPTSEKAESQPLTGVLQTAAGESQLPSSGRSRGGGSPPAGLDSRFHTTDQQMRVECGARFSMSR